MGAGPVSASCRIDLADAIGVAAYEARLEATHRANERAPPARRAEQGQVVADG